MNVQAPHHTGPATLVTPPRPSFVEVYREHAAYVWHSLRRLGVPERDRPDQVHDVFVVVLRRLDDFDSARPMKPWLFGISYRVAAAYRRRGYTRNEDVKAEEAIARASTTGDVDAALRRRDAQIVVQEALRLMDLDQRAIFILHDVDGVPVPDCVADLGAPLPTLYSRLRIAREKLARVAKRHVAPPAATAGGNLEGAPR